MFDFQKTVAYDDAAKTKFHDAARRQLRALAKELPLPPASFLIRSNMGGIAVSGEVTLHADALYVQVSQPSGGGPVSGVLFRPCKGRRDYRGGRNMFAPLSLLNDPAALAERIQRAGVAPSSTPGMVRCTSYPCARPTHDDSIPHEGAK